MSTTRWRAAFRAEGSTAAVLHSDALLHSARTLPRACVLSLRRERPSDVRAWKACRRLLPWIAVRRRRVQHCLGVQHCLADAELHSQSARCGRAVRGRSLVSSRSIRAAAMTSAPSVHSECSTASSAAQHRSQPFLVQNFVVAPPVSVQLGHPECRTRCRFDHRIGAGRRCHWRGRVRDGSRER